MRKFVALVDEVNTLQSEDPDNLGFYEGEDQRLLLAEKKDCITDFAKAQNISERAAKRICNSAEGHGYIKTETILGNTTRVSVTPCKGVDFLDRAGLIREIVSHNYKLITIILTFIAGVIIGAAGVIIKGE